MSTHTAKKQAKERDGQQCKFCGVSNEQHKSEHGRGLEAHHIIKDLDGGKDHPDNLITVCRECHNILEKTHADALSRIKEEHTAEAEERAEELESRVEKAYDRIERQDEIINSILEGVQRLLDRRGKIELHIVHETKVITSEVRYVGTDREKAYEKFEQCENHATIETASVATDITEMLDESTIEKINSDDLYHKVNEMVEGQ